MHCPACHDDSPAPAAQIRAVGICPSCGASLVFDDTGAVVRRAVATDTTALTAAERQTLKRARPRP